MTEPTSIESARPKHRRPYLVLTVTVLALAVAELVSQGSGYWQIGVFLVAPDLALVLGAGRGLAPGQLHPRAVRFYNLAHSFAGPILLGALGFGGLIGIDFGIGALAWGAHIALDRTLGYGLRTRDGYQRR